MENTAVIFQYNQGDTSLPIINLKSTVDSDVLSEDLMINDVTLFEAGTVLTPQRIEILETLGVEKVTVESRQTVRFSNIGEIYKKIDERFSYVEKKPFMMIIKSWVKDIIRERGI